MLNAPTLVVFVMGCVEQQNKRVKPLLDLIFLCLVSRRDCVQIFFVISPLCYILTNHKTTTKPPPFSGVSAPPFTSAPKNIKSAPWISGNIFYIFTVFPPKSIHLCSKILFSGDKHRVAAKLLHLVMLKSFDKLVHFLRE